MAKERSDNKLTVTVERGEIVIRLGIDRLAHSAVTHQRLRDDEDNSLVTITNAELFANEVAAKLLDEEEDGTTPVDVLFDNAILAAFEDGAEGAELSDYDVL